MASPTYLDFAMDDYKYLLDAYSRGLRYSSMVAQAQKIAERVMKHIITKSLLNNTEVMMSHNLRAIYDHLINSGIDLDTIRSNVMSLNNFYTHTQYPGKDAFLAKKEDVEDAVESLKVIVAGLGRYL